ncbi:MAG: alpha/beta hydrolase [Planctomycetota bacterium]|jgi:pimeloyl-ACP methyl ester carboxylesterase
MEPGHREVLDHPAVTGVLFYPRRLTTEMVMPIEGGEIQTIDAGGETLGGYAFRPHEGKPTVLYFHGNGEVMTDALIEFHDHMASAGANLFVVDYRGYGLSGGAPTLSNLLEDARAGWEHAVKKLGLRPDEIVIMGRSLGSLAALEVAAGPGRGARGLILESGIARFDTWVERMGFMLQASGVDLAALGDALRAHFDQEAKIGEFQGPVFVLHTENDEIVPVENGRFFAQWADPAKTTSRFFERGGHNDIQMLNKEEYFRLVSEFLATL